MRWHGQHICAFFGVALLILSLSPPRVSQAADAQTGCAHIVLTRDQVKQQAGNDASKENFIFSKDKKIFFPDIDEDFIHRCFKNSDSILFIKQDVDAQHKNAQYDKTKGK
jgi:hypothetical protein